jgi:hypothetical protein
MFRSYAAGKGHLPCIVHNLADYFTRVSASCNTSTLQRAFPEKSVRTINFGSAARCEARLCRAVSNLRIYGLCPRFGLWP